MSEFVYYAERRPVGAYEDHWQGWINTGEYETIGDAKKALKDYKHRFWGPSCCSRPSSGIATPADVRTSEKFPCRSGGGEP